MKHSSKNQNHWKFARWSFLRRWTRPTCIIFKTLKWSRVCSYKKYSFQYLDPASGSRIYETKSRYPIELVYKMHSKHLMNAVLVGRPELCYEMIWGIPAAHQSGDSLKLCNISVMYNATLSFPLRLLWSRNSRLGEVEKEDHTTCYWIPHWGVDSMIGPRCELGVYKPLAFPGLVCQSPLQFSRRTRPRLEASIQLKWSSHSTITYPAMLDFTNIDAIQFVQDSQSNIRVYYQNDDRTIRESCFNNQQKWFTRGDIVTTEAKANSPIVATRWNNGQEVFVNV